MQGPKTEQAMKYQTQGFNQLFPQAVADGVTGSRALKGAGFSN